MSETTKQITVSETTKQITVSETTKQKREELRRDQGTKEKMQATQLHRPVTWKQKLAEREQRQRDEEQRLEAEQLELNRTFANAVKHSWAGGPTVLRLYVPGLISVLEAEKNLPRHLPRTHWPEIKAVYVRHDCVFSGPQEQLNTHITVEFEPSALESHF